MKAAKGRIKNLDSCIRSLTSLNKEQSLSEVYDALPHELKGYIEPYEGDDEKFANKWQSHDFGKWRSDIHSSPDFRILNKRTGRQYFWEHFGDVGRDPYSIV